MLNDTIKTIAVINDLRIQLVTASKILTKDGYKVNTYSSAAIALQSMVETDPPDLIISDLHMPGIDGWKFCRLLRSPEYKQFNDIPVLLCSATFNGTDVEYITRDLGANAFLPIPYEASVLRSFVKDLIDGKNPRLLPRVLIVDDVEYLALHLKKHFVNNGYKVEVAVTGEEARKKFIRNRPEVAILDYHLPDCNGDELLMEFKATENPPVCIMLTGDTTPELALELTEKGADAYIQKPANRDYLLQVVQKSQRQRSLLSVEDLLERKVQELSKAQKVNSKNKEILHKAQKMARFGSYECDFRLDRVIFTEEICDLYGISTDGSGVTMNIADTLKLVHPEDREFLNNKISENKERNASVSMEYRIIRPKDGKVRIVHGENHLIRNSDGNLTSMIGTVIDITEKKLEDEKRLQMERRLTEVQRLESLADLAGGIAHDFNNLLSGVIGNVGLAMMDVPLASPILECLKDIEKSAYLATELSQQMLAYSGKGHFIFNPIELSQLIMKSDELLKSSVHHKIKLQYQMNKSLPQIKGDETQLRQILINLCVNASEAIGESDGEITISTSLQNMNENSLSKILQGDRIAAGEYVVMEVADNGSGIEPELLEKIFDPFFSTKFTGRGLGLAAVWGIVRGHKGEIEVDTKAGEGTKFRIYFPVHKPVESIVKKEKSPDLKTQNTVLLVDDEAMILRMAKRSLETANYNVVAVESGIEALKYFRKNRQSILVIVLDLSMPGMTGDEVYTQLKELDPDVRVIMSSGYSVNNIAEKYSDGNCPADFLQKPYAPEDLIGKVNKVAMS